MRAMQLAIDFRQTFGKDVVIDVVCYRRHGHQESDNPMFTQPEMYSRIKKKIPALDLYTEQLVSEGVVEMEEPLHLPSVQALLVQRGVWLRPFGRMLYTMPPFVVSEAELRRITGGMRAVVEATESALLEKGARLESEVWRESQSRAG